MRIRLSSLQLVAREAAAVVVEHTVPALRVTVRAKLRVAARVVVEAVNPALLVTHDQFGGVRGSAGLGTGAPAVTVLAAVVSDTQPALGHALLGTEHPPAALRERVADVNAALQLAHGKLIGVLAVVLEATGSSAETSHVGEERFSCIPYHGVLLNALRPARGGGGHAGDGRGGGGSKRYYGLHHLEGVVFVRKQNWLLFGDWT